MKKILFITILLLLSEPILSSGQVTDSSSVGESAAEQRWNDIQKSNEVSFVGALAKGIGALLLILLLIYGFVWMLRFFMNKKSFGNPTSEHIRLLSTTYIAPKKSVALLQVYEKAILIGVSEDSITTLTELSDESGWKELLNIGLPGKGEDSSFSQKLVNALKQNRSKGIGNKGNNTNER